jgi:lysophospholipase L1-like esterase
MDKAAKQPIRYLALGDSYTIGEAVTDNQRFPVQLTESLRANGLSMNDPLVIARTGWTTDELDAGINDANLQGMFDLVTLLIGVNNQYRGRDLEEYRVQFRGLLQRAVSFADGEAGRVIVVSIPDWGVTPFASDRDRAQIAAELDAFNTVNRQEATKAGARYADITPISRRAVEDVSLVAEDGLHPSGKMYGLWVELLLPEAAEILQ